MRVVGASGNRKRKVAKKLMSCNKGDLGREGTEEIVEELMHVTEKTNLNHQMSGILFSVNSKYNEIINIVQKGTNANKKIISVAGASQK